MNLPWRQVFWSSHMATLVIVVFKPTECNAVFERAAAGSWSESTAPGEWRSIVMAVFFLSLVGSGAQ
jgi:hypothetical protein